MELTRIDINERIAIARQLRSQALGDYLAQIFHSLLNLPHAVLAALPLRRTEPARFPVGIIHS